MASAPEALVEALVASFARRGRPLTRVGLEAGPLSRLSRRPHAGLSEVGYEAVLPETRHVKAALAALAALAAMVVKTDREEEDGRARHRPAPPSSAQLLRMGRYRPAHRKPPPARQVRALPAGRELLQADPGQAAGRRAEYSRPPARLRFGLTVGEASKGRFAARVKELIAGHEMPGAAIGAMLRAREGPRGPAGRVRAPAPGMLGIHRAGRRGLPCRRLMTAPGVAALVAVTFETAVGSVRPATG